MSAAPPPEEQLVALFESDLVTGDALAAGVPASLEAPTDAAFVGPAAASLRRALVRRIHARHQFAILESSDLSAIEAIYAESLRNAIVALHDPQRDAALKMVMEHHRARLDDALRVISERSPHGIGREVEAAEYAPELQLTVLGLDARTLPQPVLDLGCGREAHLVRYLREQGVAATGLDRDGSTDDGTIIEGDWLDTPLEDESFGTVLSHLGYSLHFLHHHLASETMAARYARRMLAILRALRPGGVFAYAPGLPFFEPLLSEAGYRIVRVRLPEGIRRSIPDELPKAVGGDVAYACQVWKRPAP